MYIFCKCCVCVTNHGAYNTAIIRWTIAPKSDVANILGLCPTPTPTMPAFVRNASAAHTRGRLITLCTVFQLFTASELLYVSLLRRWSVERCDFAKRNTPAMYQACLKNKLYYKKVTRLRNKRNIS